MEELAASPDPVELASPPVTTAAHRVYNTPEIFENVVRSLTWGQETRLLRLSKQSLVRGMEWLGKREKLPWKKYMEIIDDEGIPVTEDVMRGRIADLGNWGVSSRGYPGGSGYRMYRDAVRRSVRTITLEYPHRILGDSCARCRFSDPNAFEWLECQFPNLQNVYLQDSDIGRTRIERQHAASHGDVMDDSWDLLHLPHKFTILHLPTCTFHFHLYQNTRMPACARALADGAYDLPERWTTKGYRAVYRVRIELQAEAEKDEGPHGIDPRLQETLRSIGTDTRITAVQFQQAAGERSRVSVWRLLESALKRRHGAQKPLSKLDFDFLPEPSAEFSSLLSMATSGACSRTKLQIAPHQLKQQPDTMPTSILPGLMATRSENDDVDGAQLPLAPRNNDQSAINSGDILVVVCSRFPRRYPQLYSITSIGRTLHTMDLGRSWWRLGHHLGLSSLDEDDEDVEDDEDDYSSQALRSRRLAELIDTIVTNFPALKDLSLTMKTSSDFSGHFDRDLDVTSRRWGGSLDRLTVGFSIYIDPRIQWFPYFAIARNLASLCHSSTVISATVELRKAFDWEIDLQDFDRIVRYPDWTFVQQDLGDLVHWLLSLSPARQSAIRVADFDKLGLMPPVRSAINWRELTFVDDIPVPIDLKRLSDDYHRWTKVAEGSSAEAEEARKQKRMIDQLFSKTEGKV